MKMKPYDLSANPFYEPRMEDIWENFFELKSPNVSDEWHEYKGMRYSISYSANKGFVVPDIFVVKEITISPDGAVSVVMKERT